MHWLKKLFRGQKDHSDPRLSVDGVDINTLSLIELDAAGIELGRQIDTIREHRRALRVRADELRLVIERGGE